MWKPVRLQGVGAASSIINANTQPAGKLDPWRAKVNCLFGLALNGQPSSNGHDVPLPGGGGFEANNPYDPTGQLHVRAGWTAFHGGDNNPQVDRLPLEGVVGWDTTLNGNLAELLQEPIVDGRLRRSRNHGSGEGRTVSLRCRSLRNRRRYYRWRQYCARRPDAFGYGSDSPAVPRIAIPLEPEPRRATPATSIATRRGSTACPSRTVPRAVAASSLMPGHTIWKSPTTGCSTTPVR